jgi:Zn-finger protein
MWGIMQTKKEAIEKKISDTLNIFSFENMSKKHPDFCACYNDGKPCHKIKGLNCFFCFCPEYDNSKEEGGCKRKSKEGKWFFNEKLPNGKIWDCSDCDYPHKIENAEKMFREIFIN